MKTFEFKNKTAIIKSEKLLALISENNNVDLKKDSDLTVLYQMYEDDKNYKNPDAEIKIEKDFTYIKMNYARARILSKLLN